MQLDQTEIEKFEYPLGTQRPRPGGFGSPPHERLQLRLDVHVEDALLVVNVQARQDRLLLLRHRLDDQRGLQDIALCVAILNVSSVDVAAVVLAPSRQIGQLHLKDLQIHLLQAML